MVRRADLIREADGTKQGGSPLAFLGAGVLIGLTAVFADKVTAARQPVEGGDTARSPGELSSGGWKQVLKRTFREFIEDRIPSVAAGATFYGLLALFPAIGAFVALYGLFADVADAGRQIAALQGVLPEGAVTVLREQMTRLAAAPQSGLGLAFAGSLALSLWSANAGVKAVISGLNIAYEEQETRGFLRLNAVSLAFTAGAVVVALLGSGAMTAVPAVLDRLGLTSLRPLSLLRWPFLVLVVGAMLSLLYRFAPNRAQAKWRWITPGGAFAAGAWLLMSLGFSLYVGAFGHYDRTYGSLGAVVGFMTWIWLSLIVVLLGAELNAELEQQIRADTTTGAPRPFGVRGAAVADGVRLRQPT